MSKKSQAQLPPEVGEDGLLTYTKKEKTMYLIGLAGQNVIYNVINGIFAYFAQFTIAIPAGILGAIMAIARLWDATNDFMMGTIVDKTRSKWGKCRPYLIFVPLPVLLITISCFASFGVYSGVDTSTLFEGQNFLIVCWAAVTYILWGMTYTVGDIPLWGVTSLMTERADDRNKLLSQARMIAGIGGGIAMLTIQPIANAVTAALAKSFVWDAIFAERVGYMATAAIFALVGCALFQFAGLGIRERIPPAGTSYTFAQNMKIIVRNKPFRQILLSGILGSPKMLLMTAAFPMLNFYYANKSGKMLFLYLLLLGGGLFIGNGLFMLLVPTLNRRFEKKDLYNYSNLLSVFPYLAFFALYYFAPGHDVTTPLYLVLSTGIFFAGGGAMGLNNVLQTQMVADAVDYEEYHYGVRTDGVFFAGQTFLAKLTSAIATIVSSIAYEIVGFSGDRVTEINKFIEVGGIPRLEPKYAQFMMVLFFLVSIPPAIGSILTVLPTWKYALTDAEHKRILAALNERRHKLEAQTQAEDS